MDLQSGFSAERSEGVVDTCPPLGGGGSGTPEPRGGVKKNSSRAARPLRWFQCARCGKMVLSFKKTRGIHNKKCPPHNDPVNILGSIVGA